MSEQTGAGVVDSTDPANIPTFAKVEANVLYPLALSTSNDYNALAETLRTESVTQQKIKDVIENNEDDDKISTLSDEIDALLNSLKAKRDEQSEYVRYAYFNAETISKEKRDEIKKQLADYKDTVANIVKVGDKLTDGEFSANLPSLLKLTGLTGEATGRGANVLRPRILEAFVNGEAVKNKDGKATFGGLRKKVAEIAKRNVTTRELHEAALASVELTYDDGFDDYPTENEFEFEGMTIRTVGPKD